jgi:hypothetical protein
MHSIKSESVITSSAPGPCDDTDEGQPPLSHLEVILTYRTNKVSSTWRSAASQWQVNRYLQRPSGQEVSKETACLGKDF